MKKITLLVLVLASTLFTATAQDVVYGTFFSGDDGAIKKISASPNTGITTGSFTTVKETIKSAALGASTNGWLYYLQYGDNADGSGEGQVDIWATKADGTGTPVRVKNNYDVNGASNSDLGFVRLGIDGGNVAWLISKELNGNTIYISKFTVNGSNPVNPVSAGTLNTSDNTNSVFQNGDLAFDGTGKLYALANDGNGLTKIYTIPGNILAVLNSSSVTTLSYRWTLKKTDNSNFSGRVNGTAFTSNGSLYLSTDDGLYFINQFSVNFAGSGTVLCIKVKDENNCTDLATAYWPANTTLPVKFSTFQVEHIDGLTFKVTFKIETGEDVRQFNVMISEDGINFKSAMIIYPDKINPNKTYTEIITLK